MPPVLRARAWFVPAARRARLQHAWCRTVASRGCRLGEHAVAARQAPQAVRPVPPGQRVVKTSRRFQRPPAWCRPAASRLLVGGRAVVVYVSRRAFPAPGLGVARSQAQPVRMALRPQVAASRRAGPVARWVARLVAPKHLGRARVVPVVRWPRLLEMWCRPAAPRFRAGGRAAFAFASRRAFPVLPSDAARSQTPLRVVGAVPLVVAARLDAPTQRVLASLGVLGRAGVARLARRAQAPYASYRPVGVWSAHCFLPTGEWQARHFRVIARSRSPRGRRRPVQARGAGILGTRGGVRLVGRRPRGRSTGRSGSPEEERAPEASAERGNPTRRDLLDLTERPRRRPPCTLEACEVYP